MKLVLLDIEGRLLSSDGAGRRAIRRALLDETGMAGPIESYRLDGKTDPQIISELLSLAGHPAAGDDARIAAVCRRYVAQLRIELATSPGATRLLDGVRELLDALHPHHPADAALAALLTANLPPAPA